MPMSTASTKRTRGASTSTSTASHHATPVSPSHYSSAHPPRLIMLVGFAFVAFFLLAVMMQVQTNEALITHQGHVNVYHPNWEILWQPVALILGGLSPNEAAAAMFGWGIELIYLGFIVGYEMLQDSVAASGQMMGRLFKTLSWGIVVFNGWADFNYGSIGSSEVWGHLLFALMMSFIVGFFGTIGVFLIRHGWGRA